jgi:hypothetical protein
MTHFGVILFFQEVTLEEMMHGIFRRSSRAATMRHRIHRYSVAIPRVFLGTTSKGARSRICLALRMLAVLPQPK